MINNHVSRQPSAIGDQPSVTNRQLLVTVFFSGLVTLAVELSAFRLFAPVFGTANLISAVVIGLILLYLAAGYTLGGRWADRSPYPATLYRIIAWGAFLIGLIPFLALPLLRLARDSLQNLGNLRRRPDRVGLRRHADSICRAGHVAGLCFALCRAPRHAQCRPIRPLHGLPPWPGFWALCPSVRLNPARIPKHNSFRTPANSSLKAVAAAKATLPPTARRSSSKASVSREILFTRSTRWTWKPATP